ncbi:FG-GAP repeat domain-containing protein [Dawidia soli]|uniref:VCBS repeat-containing protein n=1 Tax=Dawidia soli TaxID=2782352 RepID=A0AAP2DDJ6_9BACT|nr:VCBS repeat-containing protein [Dawidia soli]MBT1689201.1 VCBS repeat-containing protein [Dawidia soli]
MIQQFTHFSFFVCLCSLFVFHSAGAQAPFERYVAESSLPAEVLQAPDGTYFILTDPLAYLNRLDSEGRLINRWQLETTPASTFPYRGLGLTSTRVFAVGGEHGGTLVLHSTNYDLADRHRKTLYTGDFTGGRVAGLAGNGAAVVISVLNDNGFRNPQLFLTDANLNVQTTRTYTLPGNTEVFYIGQATNGDLLLVGRDENTGNGALVRTQSDGTPRVATPSVPAVLDGKVYGNKLYLLAATNGGMTATLYVLGDNFHIDQQQDLFTHTAALSAANTRLAVGYNGTVAVATPADGKSGFDLHTFASGTFTPTGTVYHDLERGGSTVPVYGSAADNGFVFLVQTRDEAHVSSDLAVVLRTNATGQGPERLAMENLSPNGLEDVDSTAFIQWADLDNDGQREALITNDKISVYRYDATAGKFVRINTPFPGPREHFQSLSTADIDNDGDLDVYINRHHPNYTGVSLQPLPNILYRNNGNGSYTAEGGTICPDGMATRQSFWIDLNNDQWLDLYLSGYNHDRAYLNHGDGVTFTELDLTFLPGKHNIEDVPDGMLWDDLNGDGYIDAINQAEEEDMYILLNQHGTGFTRVPLQQHITLFGPPFQMPHAQDFTLGYVNGTRTLVMSDFNYLRYFEHDGTRYVEKPRPSQLVFTQTKLT